VDEEPRFFLRNALYSLIAGTIYWFVSYEWIGTILLAFVVFGAGFFAAAVGTMLRGDHGKSAPRRTRSRVIGGLNRAIGFEDSRDDSGFGPLAIEEEPISPSSVWPVLAAIAALLIGLGLIHGAWFWLPGVLLGATTTWGWITELTR
jgi:hypothetical protein